MFCRRMILLNMNFLIKNYDIIYQNYYLRVSMSERDNESNSISELLQIDRVFWNTDKKQRIQQFIQCNSYLSKLYQPAYLNNLINILYFQKLSNNATINFEGNNKRPIVIILLNGQIKITKIIKQKKNFLQVNNIFTVYNSAININVEQDCVVKTITKLSQFIYIPNNLYLNYIYTVQKEKQHKAFLILEKQFPKANKKQIQELSQVATFNQYNFKHRIYNKGEIPIYVYILLMGKVLQQKPSNKYNHNITITIHSARPCQQQQIICEDSNTIIFGDSDINNEIRNHSSICNSASVQLLLIPKKQYIFFMKNYFPEIQPNFRALSSKSKKDSEKDELGKFQFPSLNLRKVRSNSSRNNTNFERMAYNLQLTDEQQSLHSHRLMQNSHTLVQFTSPNKKGGVVRKCSPNKIPVAENQQDPMKKKFQLFKKLRPQKILLDINHRLI